MSTGPLSSEQLKELTQYHLDQHSDTDNTSGVAKTAPVSVPEEDEDGLLRTALDAAIAGEEGYTLGLGSKALSGIESIHKTKNLTDLQELKNQFFKALEANEQSIEEAKKRSPKASFAAGLIGAMANPLPGAGAKLAGEAIGLGKGAKALGTMLGSEEVLPKVLTSIGESGILAAGASALNTEGPIKNQVKDVALGTGIGLGAGLLGHGVGALAGKAANFLNDLPIVQKAIRAFKLEKGTPTETNPEGLPIDIGSESGQDAIIRQFNYAKDKVNQSLRKLVSFAKDEYDDFFDRNGKKLLDPNDHEIKESMDTIFSVLNENKDQIAKATGSKILNNVLESSSDPMLTGRTLYKGGSVSQLSDIRKALLQHHNNIEDRDAIKAIFGDEGKNNGLIDLIEDVIDTKFPDYSKLKNNIDIAAMPAEMLISGASKASQRTTKLSDLTKAQIEASMDEKAGVVLEGLAKGGLSAAKTRNKFYSFLNQYEQSLNHLMENSPTFSKVGQLGKGQVVNKSRLEQLAEALEDIESRKVSSAASTMTPKTPLEEMAAKLESLDKTEISPPSRIVGTDELRKISTESGKDLGALIASEGLRPGADPALEKIFGVKSPFNFGVVKSGRYAGKAAKYVDIKNAPIDKLKEWAQVLSNNPNPAKANFGRASVEALENSSTGRAVFLNNIMQNPDTRKMLGLSVNKKDEENQSSYSEPKAFTEQEREEALNRFIKKKGLK